MPKYTRPHYQRYICNNPTCNHVWKIRTPDDPFHHVAQCPNCGGREDEGVSGRDGKPIYRPEGLFDGEGKLKLDLENKILPAVDLVDGHLAHSRWKKLFAKQERELPYNAPLNQHVRISTRFIDKVSMKLSHLELRLIILFLRFTDGNSGWTPPLSQGTLGIYCMGRGRDEPVDDNTIRKAVKTMNEIMVDCYDAANDRTIPRRLVEVTASFPRKFRVNLP